jgi:hypothetical protein
MPAPPHRHSFIQCTGRQAGRRRRLEQLSPIWTPSPASFPACRLLRKSPPHSESEPPHSPLAPPRPAPALSQPPRQPSPAQPTPAQPSLPQPSRGQGGKQKQKKWKQWLQPRQECGSKNSHVMLFHHASRVSPCGDKNDFYFYWAAQAPRCVSPCGDKTFFFFFFFGCYVQFLFLIF